MEEQPLVPAAQYLRVSTERQEYSLDFQGAEIASYAAHNGFVIVETYRDEAKSGLVIKHRAGLSRLLQDVVTGKHHYRAILVYDVSRWGRFQDPDEAAHYEFLCKTAGVPVHYCAEHFSNDVYLPNLILKALKRVMAGEYSRELSEKVFASLTRVVKQGFRPGGQPGYGFRRVLLSSEGVPKGQLDLGQRKSIRNERVVLVLGPGIEVSCVREIYRMFISQGLSMQSIADELNRQAVPFQGTRQWKGHSVRRILTNPKYKGTAVYNRTTSRLKAPQRPTPESEWIVVPDAIPSIVDAKTFEAAQKVFREKHWNLSNEQVLEPLMRVLKAQGELTSSLICGEPYTLSMDGYRRRFGTLTNAFKLAGYNSPRIRTAEHRMTLQKLRTELMYRLVHMFPGDVSIFSRGPICKDCLRLKNGTRIGVRVCRSKTMVIQGQVWVMQPAGLDERLVSLVAGTNADNTALELFYVLPPIANRCQVNVCLNHQWLKNGVRLSNLSSFCEVVRSILLQWKGKAGIPMPRTKGWMSQEARFSIAAAQRTRWERLRVRNR
jgi:DNA invertase Pin-like site-specific DNA recombinase